jgi:signal transduction histidine kinase/GTP-sensing pleiotropic transcriptional regulator CodY
MIETTEETNALAEVVVAHDDPKKADLLREMRRLYPPHPERPDIPLRVLRTGKAELIPKVSDALLENIAHNADHLRMLQRLAFRSLIVTPLWVRGRAIGTTLLAQAGSGRQFTPDDLELAEDLARRVALAIDNAALHRAEQEARRKAQRAAERMGRLQAVTAALSGALTPAAAAEVLVDQGSAAVGADGGFVRLLTSDGSDLELIAATGYSKSFTRAHVKLPLTSNDPGVQTFRSRSPRYFGSGDSVDSASVEFRAEHAASRHEAIAFLPLHGHRRMIGVLALSFATPRSFEDDEREFLVTLTGQGSQAIERAQLYEAERDARAAAVGAVERTTYLQALAGELAGALTPAQVADVVVAQGIASAGADAGALQLLNGDGTALQVVCAQGSDPDLVGDEWLQIPIDLKLPSTDAVHRREPIFIESATDIRENYPLMPTREPALRARAGAHIPLIVGEQPLGVLFLGFSRLRRFSESQRSFVLALGRQGAQALKRAQLYEAELEARGRLSLLVERLQEGVVSVDRRGRVEFASSTAKEMLGPARLEEGSEVPEAWFGFPLRRFVAKLVEAEEPVVEAQVVSQNGERVFDIVGISAIRTESALLIVRDVSERERRQRVEHEFVTNAAHELRTPLAAITSAIERLQAGAREVADKRDRYLGHIQNESARLNRLASSLLVLARAQTREEEPRRQEILLRELLEDLADGLELNPGVELTLDCPVELLVNSNRDLLEHALLNLAGNAVRHTDCGHIRLSARSDEDGTTTIDVSDTGAGIPADELGRLFDRFYRGSGEEGRTGFGLGLPIVKEAVGAMGGRVEIESIVGKGTIARIVLPGTRTVVLA